MKRMRKYLLRRLQSYLAGMPERLEIARNNGEHLVRIVLDVCEELFFSSIFEPGLSK